jgi:hypothetical protein
MQVQLALATAVIAALAVPVLAQSGGGIAGVLPAGAVPELVKEGFVGTEGPVGTADGGLYFSDNRAATAEPIKPLAPTIITRMTGSEWFCKLVVRPAVPDLAVKRIFVLSRRLGSQ